LVGREALGLRCRILPHLHPFLSASAPPPAASRLSPGFLPVACTLACRVIAAAAAVNGCGDALNELSGVVILELAAFVYALSSQIIGRKTRSGTGQWLQQGMFSLWQWMDMCV